MSCVFGVLALESELVDSKQLGGLVIDANLGNMGHLVAALDE